MSSSEVIVIGGGPAGSAAAISLAQRGLEVVIFEGSSFPRHRPGETLHPGIEPLCQQLGVVDRLLTAAQLRHEGNWVQWEGSCHFVPFGGDEKGPWRGFQVLRADLDAILLHRAQELGVRVRQPCRVCQPILQDNRIAGAIASDGEWRSRFIIDATGSRRWLAKQLKLTVENHSPLLIANYGYAEGNCPLRDEAPAIVADDLGWTWTARVRPQLYQWTRLSFVRENVREKIAQNWLPAELSGLQPAGKPRAADVTWRVVREMAGAGYFIVGDAAAVLDPASSHGVLKAIMSGIMAGDAIDRILKCGEPESRITKAYCQWLGDWFEEDLVKLKEFYNRLDYTF